MKTTKTTTPTTPTTPTKMAPTRMYQDSKIYIPFRNCNGYRRSLPRRNISLPRRKVSEKKKFSIKRRLFIMAEIKFVAKELFPFREMSLRGVGGYGELGINNNNNVPRRGWWIRGAINRFNRVSEFQTHHCSTARAPTHPLLPQPHHPTTATTPSYHQNNTILPLRQNHLTTKTTPSYHQDNTILPLTLKN